MPYFFNTVLKRLKDFIQKLRSGEARLDSIDLKAESEKDIPAGFY